MNAGRLPAPPSAVTGELGNWLRNLWGAVNALPRVSYFSGVSPNTSAITGMPGDLAINLGSASTDTRVWIMGGSMTTMKTSGWVALRTLA